MCRRKSFGSCIGVNGYSGLKCKGKHLFDQAIRHTKVIKEKVQALKVVTGVQFSAAMFLFSTRPLSFGTGSIELCHTNLTGQLCVCRRLIQDPHIICAVGFFVMNAEDLDDDFCYEAVVVLLVKYKGRCCTLLMLSIFQCASRPVCEQPHIDFEFGTWFGILENASQVSLLADFTRFPTQ